MKANIKPCLEEHLIDKAKAGTTIPPDTWFDAAETHIRSAQTLLDADPAASFTLGWLAMHRIAKGLAAINQVRLELETHGKVVDFLCCVFDQMSAGDKGLVRRASTGRNTLAYDDPRSVDRAGCDSVLELAGRMLAAARANTQPAPAPKKPPPPPPPPSPTTAVRKDH